MKTPGLRPVTGDGRFDMFNLHFKVKHFQRSSTASYQSCVYISRYLHRRLSSSLEFFGSTTVNTGQADRDAKSLSP